MQAALRLQHTAVSASINRSANRRPSRREQLTLSLAYFCVGANAHYPLGAQDAVQLLHAAIIAPFFDIRVAYEPPYPQFARQPQIIPWPPVLPVVTVCTGLAVAVRAHGADEDEAVLPIWSGRMPESDPEKLKWHSARLGGKTLGEELGELHKAAGASEHCLVPRLCIGMLLCYTVLA
jgi:hypothetical protein